MGIVKGDRLKIGFAVAVLLLGVGGGLWLVSPKPMESKSNISGEKIVMVRTENTQKVQEIVTYRLAKVDLRYDPTLEQLAFCAGISREQLRTSNPAVKRAVGSTWKLPIPPLGDYLTSWYGNPAGDSDGMQYNGRHMANGKTFTWRDATVVAHRYLPFGTRIQLLNPANGKKHTVVVQDRGPYVAKRCFDLSPTAAAKLGMLKITIIKNKKGDESVRIKQVRGVAQLRVVKITLPGK